MNVNERINTLIIKDISRSIPADRNLVKSLDTKTPLVLIKARIIEASTNFQRELGVRWGITADLGSHGRVGGGTPATTLGTATRNVVSLPAVARGGVGAGRGGGPRL